MELKIADQHMYGYRHTGPNEPPTRVRVIAGQQIPPDLVDLEPMPEEDVNPTLFQGTHARLTAEEQAKAQEERNASVVGVTGERHDASIPDPDAPVSRGTRRQRQERSGAIPTPDAPSSAKEKKD